MNRKILLISLSLAVIICISLVFAACGQSTQYSELEMEEGIVYLTDYSVKYTSEEESPLGEINESTLSEEKSGSVQTYYLVMDFDMQTAEDIPGMEWLTVTMKVLDANVVKATINYTNTSSTQEITSNGETIITATYSLPEKAKELKNVSLVVELEAQNVGTTDIIYSFKSDNKQVTGYSEEDSTYNLSDNSVTIKNTSFEYTLNKDRQSYSVSGIGTKFGIISIPDTYRGLPITAISDSAFYECSSLTGLTIPDSMTSIGDSAFESCTSLTSITIPDSLTTIGYSAFNGCSLLTYNNYENGNYLGNDNNKYIVLVSVRDTSISAFTINSNTKIICYEAFYNCSKLKSITIPDNITSIGKYAFYNCTALTEINFNATAMQDLYFGDCIFSNAGQNGNGITLTIGAKVTKVPAYLFSAWHYIDDSEAAWSYDNSLSKLSNVEFEANSKCTSIGKYAFDTCKSLTNITIPDSITAIGDGAFDGCSSLTYNDYEYGKYLGNDNNKYMVLVDVDDILISTFTINLNTKIIYYQAFYNCRSLTSITIPDSVTSIGNEAFCYCASLTSITIPDSVTTIGNYAFYECSSLTNITIPDSTTSIGDYAFGYCESLMSATIGNCVTKIGECAFESCTSLKSVTMGDSITTIGVGAFEGCESLTSITIPDSVTTIGDYAFNGCSSLTYNSYENGNYLGNDNNKYMVLVSVEDTSVSSFTINSNTKIIHSAAFYNCNKLKSITIPDNVTSIGEGAFVYCTSLTSVTIGNNVTTIGGSAFYGCSKLTSITIPNSVTSIGYYAFYGCSKLTSITFKNRSGWYATEYEGDTATISDADLSNSSTAAEYLTSTYYRYYWYRSES